jgi:hypothetical protein
MRVVKVNGGVMVTLKVKLAFKVVLEKGWHTIQVEENDKGKDTIHIGSAIVGGSTEEVDNAIVNMIIPAEEING